MKKLFKTLAVTALAIGVTVASLASSADARPRHRHYGGAAAAIIGLGVAGLILSEASRDRRHSRVYVYDDRYDVSCRRLANRCDDGSRRACREWRRYCD